MGIAIRDQKSSPRLLVHVTATTPIAVDGVDSLVCIDRLMAGYRADEQSFSHAVAATRAERDAFVRAATSALREVIKPLFGAVSERLTDDGGGGLVEERAAQTNRGLRLTLWMSLDGPVIRPRQDLNPYMQLDVDARHRQVSVWEGDMWRGQGASRRASPLALEELTSDVVLDRVADVVSRATAHTSWMAAIWNGEDA